MPMKDYVAKIQEVVSVTSFVTSTSLTYEERPPSGGFIKATLVFVDGSQLNFKEFLLFQPTLRILKYGYHYQKGRQLIFRYDNANDPAARSFSTFPSHKHLPSGLLAASKPSLEQVLQEITSSLKGL